jgi:hypothetical protein
VLGVKGGLGCCRRGKPTTPDFGVWVKDPQEGTFLVHGSESTMREIFGNVIEKMPVKLVENHS